MKKGGFVIALLFVLSTPAFSQEVDRFSVNENSHLFSCMNCHEGKFAKGLKEIGKGVKSPDELVRVMGEKCLGYGEYAKEDAENIFKELKNVAGSNSKTVRNNRGKNTKATR